MSSPASPTKVTRSFFFRSHRFLVSYRRQRDETNTHTFRFSLHCRNTCCRNLCTPWMGKSCSAWSVWCGVILGDMPWQYCVQLFCMCFVELVCDCSYGALFEMPKKSGVSGPLLWVIWLLSSTRESCALLTISQQMQNWQTSGCGVCWDVDAICSGKERYDKSSWFTGPSTLLPTSMVMMREEVMKGIMKTASKSPQRHFQLCFPD